MNWNPSWANAIASIESQGSGGYSAVGPITQKGNRAYGKYQVMDFNIPAWTEKHLGQELTTKQFLQSPEAQDAVFKGEFGSYVSKYGNPQDAASAWFTGQPQSKGSNKSDMLGTTGSGYVNKFNNALGTGATSTGGPQMMQPKQQPPKGLLGSLGIQKMEEGAEGDAGERFYNRKSFGNTLASLAPALGRMGVMGLEVPAQAVADRRFANQKEAADEAKSIAQRNKTAEFLAANGRKDLAGLVSQGIMSGSNAAKEMVGSSSGKDTALIRNALAAGFKPGTKEYERFIASGGDIYSQETALMLGLPKPEAGMTYEFEKGESGNITGYSLVPIKGGSADRDAQKKDDAGNTVVTTAGVVLNNIDAIQDKLKNSMLPVAGFSGSQFKKIPGTSAYDVNALTTTIKANIGFDRLQRMRMESPTGGALGNVSNQELESLQATLGNLDQSQSQKQFEEQLQIIENMYLSIIEKFNSYPEDAKAKAGYSNIGLSQGAASAAQPNGLSKDAASFLED